MSSGCDAMPRAHEITTAGIEASAHSRKRNERRAKARAVKRESQGDDKTQRVVVWFRDDLRLDDNPALHEASRFASLIC
eukprot:3829225-Pyramimonas_sp.AAC.1